MWQRQYVFQCDKTDIFSKFQQRRTQTNVKSIDYIRSSREDVYSFLLLLLSTLNTWTEDERENRDESNDEVERPKSINLYTISIVRCWVIWALR